MIERNFGLQVLVEDEFSQGVKFAKFFGFKPTNLTKILANGRGYRVYEAF